MKTLTTDEWNYLACLLEQPETLHSHQDHPEVNRAVLLQKCTINWDGALDQEQKEKLNENNQTTS